MGLATPLDDEEVVATFVLGDCTRVDAGGIVEKVTDFVVLLDAGFLKVLMKTLMRLLTAEKADICLVFGLGSAGVV